MARRGGRSREARIRRRVARENQHRLREQTVFSRQLVGKEAHRDLRLKEVVNVLSPKGIFGAVKEEFGFVVVGLPCWAEGEVMVDGRGGGSLQMKV